jgi:Zn finger protein HypA/HybF involved in hydrogenase expression
MHELSLTQNLLGHALKNANSKRIVNVNLWIGPFSDDREESIKFYWRDLAKGTPGEEAQLHFQHVTVDTKCMACGGTFSLDDDRSICMYCHTNGSPLLGEDEVKLESIDVE